MLRRPLTVSREWDLCIPDDKLEAARSLLLAGNAHARYEAARPPPPVPWSRRHALPCLRRKGYNFWFILWLSSYCFVDPSRAEHVDKSMNGVPYASLVQFARSLLLQQLTPDIADFIDGMDLTADWGAQNIGFETLQEESVKFIESRNQLVENDDQGQSKNSHCGWLSPRSMDSLWNESASQEAKDRRIEPMKKGRYFTRWRRIRSPGDPRTKDRPV